MMIHGTLRFLQPGLDFSGISNYDIENDFERKSFYDKERKLTAKAKEREINLS